MDLNLRGRTALITGASKGIGFATASTLADEGCNLILVSRTAADLDAARLNLAARSSVRVVTHALDVSKSASIDKLAAEHGDIDILVNNAGAIPAGRLNEIDEKRWRNSWELKVFGYINMTRAFYATMKKKGSGVIINILGVAGERLEVELHRRLDWQRGTDGLHEIDGQRLAGRQHSCYRHQSRTHRDGAPRNHHAEAGAGPPGRRQQISRDVRAAAVRARGKARGDRIDGRIPGVRSLGLHDRDSDHHRRRRREQGERDLTMCTENLIGFD